MNSAAKSRCIPRGWPVAISLLAIAAALLVDVVYGMGAIVSATLR